MLLDCGLMRSRARRVGRREGADTCRKKPPEKNERTREPNRGRRVLVVGGMNDFAVVLFIPMKNSTHGRIRRSSVPHSKRPELRGEIHVVLRIRRGLPNLRTPRTYRVLERAFRAAKEKDGFGLAQYSVQQDHLHLVVWAVDKQKLARAMQGFAIRVAKALNRHWKRRLGGVFAERYFARAIERYSELRRVIRYVLPWWATRARFLAAPSR